MLSEILKYFKRLSVYCNIYNGRRLISLARRFFLYLAGSGLLRVWSEVWGHELVTLVTFKSMFQKKNYTLYTMINSDWLKYYRLCRATLRETDVLQIKGCFVDNLFLQPFLLTLTPWWNMYSKPTIASFNFKVWCWLW